MKRRAILKVTHEVIRAVFDLPEDITILGIETLPEDFGYDRFSVKLQGDKLFDVPEGSPIPWISSESLRERYNGN